MVSSSRIAVVAMNDSDTPGHTPVAVTLFGKNMGTFPLREVTMFL